MQDREESAVNYSIWIGRVIGWDGLLPCFVSTASHAVALLFPNNQWFPPLILIALPLTAFLFRYSVGTKQIKGNSCSVTVQRAQVVALGVAVFIMVFVDFIIVLSAFVQKNSPMPVGLVTTLVVVLGVYLALVLFAMYPGHQSDWRDPNFMEVGQRG